LKSLSIASPHSCLCYHCLSGSHLTQGLSWQVVVAVLLAVQFNAHSGQAIDKGIGTGVIVLICLFIAGFGWSWGPLVGNLSHVFNLLQLAASAA
jgi:hypothetical protein